MAPLPMRYHFARHLMRHIIAHPAVMLLLVSAVTLFFLCHLPRLSFKTSIYDLIIEDIPASVRYKQFQETFGTEEIIRVVIKAENIWQPSVFEKITQLSAKVSQIQGVRRVISLPAIKQSVEMTGNIGLEAFEKIIQPVTLFHRNLLSEDHRRTVLTLVLALDADRDKVVNAVSAFLSEFSNDLTLYQIGMPLVSKALGQLSKEDFLRIPPVTLVIIAVFLFILFRKKAGVAIPLLCVGTALVWTFGLFAVTKTPLSLLTMIVPAFLIAVGTAYCLHICSAYFSSVTYTSSPAEAALATYSQVAFPTSLAVLTTMVGIGSLLVNRMTAIREFAIFSCFGMVSLLVISLTLLPTVIALLPVPKTKEANRDQDQGPLKRFLEVIIDADLNWQSVILPLFLLLTIFFVVGAFRIRVETNPLHYFKKDTEIYKNFHDIHQDLSGSFPVTVVLKGPEENYFEDPSTIGMISRLEAALEVLPNVDKAISFADYLMLVNYATNRYNESFYTLPEEGFELRMLINNYRMLLGDDMLARFMTPDFSSTNILLLTHISSSEEFLQLEEKIKSLMPQNAPQEIRGEVTGLGVAVSASSHLLTQGQIKSLSLSLVLISGIMVLLFLSFKVGIIAIVPNFFPIIVNLGLMGWLGIPLSLATSLIAGIAIGLAVDDTIHYLVRYNWEFKKDLDKDRALRDTIYHIGKPIVFTSITVALGFSVLMFSQFQPTAIFGFLMVVTMAAALVGDLILLPSLMRHVELVTAWDMLRLMPTIGGMSAGIVHELNQPLNAIKMGSDYLTMISQPEKPVPADQVHQVANEIGQQVDRASHIIQRLGDLDRKPKFEREPVDINRVIQNTMTIVAHQLSIENISVTLELEANLPPVNAHENRLGQAVYNLLSNAVEAILSKRAASGLPQPGRLMIRTFRQRRHVVVQVTDSGIGMSDLEKERIFEPFFTTKGTGAGKGLGLTITQEIVRDYGGKISAESKENQGATLTMRFPAIVGSS
jgi:uncharacterized protein